ncbi:MAG: tricarballylate utilization 4Fe-4S protein TcuB [Proteobacteria bacterium]|nr:tricarballylate utilization 4Fe-4S protein TcuB [Pseudomonadota bacterium]
MHGTSSLSEVDRLLTICNGCRYCEGLCAVFPAMEMRRTFADADINYLANLCHQCSACYSDCQYSPPHEFSVNIPAAMAVARNDSYAQYVWPGFLAGVFNRNGLLVTLLTATSLAAFVIGFVLWVDPAALYSRHAGDFYKVMPHNAMASIFGAVALYAVLAFTISLTRFWRDINGGTPIGGRDFGRAVIDTFHLTYLHGGGGGCTSEDDKPSPSRRIFHHFTFYGFLLCFAATSVATLYHYVFGWHAPYNLVSLPVILGTVGGIGLLVGPAGLYALSLRRDPTLTDDKRRGMATAFIAMLFLVALSGLLLMLLRDTAAMGILLAIHLGTVLGLFLSLPYGKFVHGLYRFLALVKYAAERRQGAFVE